MMWIALFFLITPSQGSAPDWLASARDLRSEAPGVREGAIQRLRAIPDLTSVLRGELNGPHRPQVLAAAEALKVYELVPDLLGAGAKDREGYVYGSVNQLIRPGNRAEIQSAYLARLQEFDSGSGAGAKIMLLAGLASMKTLVSPDLLQKLTGDHNSQVRIAAIRCSGRLAGSAPNPEGYLRILREASTRDPYQIRMNALFALAELPSRLAAAAGVDFVACGKDSRAQVREACSLAGKRAQEK